MRRFTGLLFLSLAVVAVAAGAGERKKASVTVMNESEWSIHHFYLSSVDEDEWGADQLGKDTIEKGESFKLTDIPCDTYDVKLVDEDGDQCIIEEVDVCGTKETWTITSKDLLKCQAATS